MATGTYECWYFNQAQLTLNFTVDGPGTYTGYDGASGTYSVDALGAVTFLSGPLQGVMPDGFVASYEVRQGIPTLSYISGRGAEAAFCQRV
ncbi:hypothetical protein [Aquibium oceanicum]|nr:hypothetical protein [Aquibium oceanicum]